MHAINDEDIDHLQPTVHLTDSMLKDSNRQPIKDTICTDNLVNNNDVNDNNSTVALADTPDNMLYKSPLNSDWAVNGAVIQQTDDICACPICDIDFTDLSLPERELHADQCAINLFEKPTLAVTDSNAQLETLTTFTNDTGHLTQLLTLTCCRAVVLHGR
ncbi:hypothetical protein BDF19DRAFT_185971 [Syncephalis fuscata]|nr:hypothetical protein BDF19DRAFT_185971 [Syncephalis fuscata]